MKNYDVTNFKELHDAIFEHGKVYQQWLFRGQKDKPPKFKLVPSLGRPPFDDPELNENHIFDNWKVKAKGLLKEFGNISELDALCLSQQHFCPTKLLDWSWSPLVAAYFAVREYWDNDSFIYCLSTDSLKWANDEKKFDLLNINEDIMLYDPGSLTQQLINQSVVLTVHKNRTKPLTDLSIIKPDALEQITIKKSYRKTLLQELSFYNIHDWTLFPNLDGLGNRLAWSTKNTLERADIYLKSLSKA